ncbi:MAG: hypothetical protein ACK4SZ_03055 [Allosphingosinicella sp.]|uniref:hypothetical protein n=1 Tax=Allosphingosinicella sp. TaxID=2823234 RepID=UPI00392AA4DA
MSRVYRFHGPAALVASDRPVLLLKRRKRAVERLHPVGADRTTVTDRDGTRPIEAYLAPTGGRAVTLTRRESDLIALTNPGIAAPQALEDLHPWLPACLFLNDSAASLRQAESILRRFGHQLVSAASYCDEKWNTICNSLRRRSVHDARFYTAWHLAIQEAHVLHESGSNRSVIAIDFNGMYPACMQYPFPKPSDLRLVRINRDFEESTFLAAGLYRCILSEPATEFIVRHNPFRSFHSGRHLRARLDEAVEIDLNEFEVQFFKRHFRRVHLVEAVVADTVIAHPLAKEVRRSFARRDSYRSQGNKALADREKYLATLMTSCASRPFRTRRKFNSRDQAMATLRSLYGIDVPAEEPEAVSDRWLNGRRGVALSDGNRRLEVQGPSVHDGSACHLLGQRIVARGRIVLLKMMERLVAIAPDVKICYANIDSIHFSLPNSHLDGVLALLEREASNAMGSFKIEAVTRHGLWLEPGRYWLYSDSRIDKFRNRSVGNLRDPFKSKALYVATRKIGELHVPIRVTIQMDRTMSPSRSVGADVDGDTVRQHLIEVGSATTFAQVLDELEKNHRQAIPIRMNAFADLREKVESSRIAASRREEEASIKFGAIASP